MKKRVFIIELPAELYKKLEKIVDKKSYVSKVDFFRVKIREEKL